MLGLGTVTVIFGLYLAHTLAFYFKVKKRAQEKRAESAAHLVRRETNLDKRRIHPHSAGALS